MFWDNWLGITKEKRTQLYFPDYGGFQFRKLPLEDGCLVEKQNGEIIKAWKHFYSSQIPFNGYEKISADMVTLGFDRDFVLDPFNKIPEAENPSGKPGKTESQIKKWTAQIAESQRYKATTKPGKSAIEQVTMYLGIGLLLLILIFGMKVAWG